MIKTYPSENSKRIKEILICGTNFSLKEPYSHLETNFIKFKMADLFLIPNLKSIKKYLIFGTNLDLNGKRCWQLTLKLFLEQHPFF